MTETYQMIGMTHNEWKVCSGNQATDGLWVVFRVNSIFDKSHTLGTAARMNLSVKEMGGNSEHITDSAHAVEDVIQARMNQVDRGFWIQCTTPYPQFELQCWCDDPQVSGISTFQVLERPKGAAAIDMPLMSGPNVYAEVSVAIDMKYVLRPGAEVITGQNYLASAADNQDIMTPSTEFNLGPGKQLWSGFEGDPIRFLHKENIPHGFPSTRREFIAAGDGDHYLGSGTYGKVFKVYCQGRPLALKRAQGQVTEEIHTMINTPAHKHILRYVGSYTQEGYTITNFLLWPVCVCDLESVLQKLDKARKYPSQTSLIDGRLALSDATLQTYLRSLYGCIMNGLDFLHQQFIFHHDFKPANVLLREGGDGGSGSGVVISDFGLSNYFANGGISTSRGSGQKGTQLYFSPEIQAEQPRGTSSDIYAAGIIFVEIEAILAGLVLSKFHDSLRQHIGNSSWLLSWIDRKLPGNHLRDLLQRMLAAGRDDRSLACEVSLELYRVSDADHIYHGVCCPNPRDAGAETEAGYQDYQQSFQYDQVETRLAWSFANTGLN